MIRATLSHQLKTLPAKPGVYQFFDGERLLYVGKAKNLKHRIKSYFSRKHPERHGANSAVEGASFPQPARDLSPSKRLMVAHIDRVETTVVSNETEALLYEAELIKRFHPPFNVVMADDRSFVYIKFDFDRTWSDVYPLRRPRVHRKSRSLLFGPYPSARAAYTVLKLAKHIFPYCQKLPRRLAPPHPRGCLNWHLGRCPGPCRGIMTPASYAENLKRMIPLFQGQLRSIAKTLQQEMRAASRTGEFEKAAVYRDQLKSLNLVAARQNIVGTRKESYDVASLARDARGAVVNLFRVREGALVGRMAIPLAQSAHARDEELLQSFAELYYATTADIPRLLLAPCRLTPILPRMSVAVPRRGKKRQLLLMGEENAREELARSSALRNLNASRLREALASLMTHCQLSKFPERIEAYDVSHNQGTHAYGAMTVMVNGILISRAYRSFKIRTVAGSNDAAMLRETLTRRLAHTTHDWAFPDLIVIDGGMPQLKAARAACEAYDLQIPLLAIAKGRGLGADKRRARGEEIWLANPGSAAPTVLQGQGRALPLQVRLLLDRIRDEAHRFGVTRYRGKHRTSMVATSIDDIAGIGAKTRALLLRSYGSWEAVRRAPRGALARLIGEKKAHSISMSRAY